MAVYTLPPEMIGFYKYYIDYITEHSTDPDKRRYAVDGEAEKHYIDIDHYSINDKDAFEQVPQKWTAAVAKYSEDTLKTYGIVPWQINLELYNLSNAFENRNIEEIISVSADIGHYIADAHVPLHTTENYDGQMTGQKGIHGFWESRLPELFAQDYDYLVGRAEYIEEPLQFIWEMVEESHSYVDSVLLIEKRLAEQFDSDQKYAFEQRGQSTVKQYSAAYSEAYHRLLDGMVEERMRNAIAALGSLWYTAWVNAGQPPINDLLEPSELENSKKRAGELNNRYPIGIEKGRIHEKSD